VRLIEPISKASFKYADTQVLDGLAKEFGLSRNTVRGYISYIDSQGVSVRRPYSNGTRNIEQRGTIDPPRTASEKAEYFQRAWLEYQELIGMPRNHKAPKQRKIKPGTHRKLAVFSDTHGSPYKEGIASVINEKPDMILVVGDIFDQLCVSRFPHSENVTIESEMANVRAMVEELSSAGEVLLSRGNHDSRMWKMFASKIDAQYLQFVNTNMLSMSITGLDNCRVVENLHGFHLASGKILPNEMKDDFMIFMGDACFMHAESARKGDQNTVRPLATEWYPMWKGVLGLPDIKLLGQAHVHGASMSYSQGGHLLTLELGCMLNPAVLNYQLSGDTRYRAATIGYWIIEQEKKNGNWITNPNSVRFNLC
jgi:predicted phosphodiesterase